MYCAISGEIPKEPVVAKTTGLLFEKSLIEKALRVEGKCPVTGQPLSEDDLIVVQASKLAPPRTTAPISVPGLLHALQQEWDEHVLESFQLKAQLEATRKELAHSLYQHDAACRVIARLMRERDEARHLLQQFQVQSSVPSSHAMDVVEPTNTSKNSVSSALQPIGVSEDVLTELNTMCKSLSSTRKSRKPSDALVSKESMTSLHEVARCAPHNAPVAAVKDVVLAVHATQQVAATACVIDNNNSNHHSHSSGETAIVLTDLRTGKARCRMNTAEGVSVTHLSFAPLDNDMRSIFSADSDKMVKVWTANGSGGYQTQSQLSLKNNNNNSASISGLAVHPSAHFLACTTANHQWHLLDTTREALLATVSCAPKDVSTVFSCCALHPDGLILGTGTTSGVLKIWDTREQKNVSDLTGHSAAVRSLAFSENGYLAVSGSANGEVKLWDLRKLVSTKSLAVGSSSVDTLSFDYSGVYLGIGCGNNVTVQVVKDWTASTVIADAHKDRITGLGWTEHARGLVTASVDGTVRTFSPK